jgi:hypothetical protein
MNGQAEPITIPPLWCPIPSAIQPDWRAVDQGTIAWMKEFAIAPDPIQRDRLARSAYGELAARWMPHGSHERVRLLADFLLWICAPDDDADEGEPARSPAGLVFVYSRILQAIEGSYTPVDPDTSAYARAVRDIRLRFGEIASPIGIAHWIESVQASLFAMLREAANRARDIIPDLDDYLMTRLQSIWMRPVATFVASIDGRQTPIAELEEPAVRALIEMMSMVVAIDNDILSYEKERVRGGESQNILTVLAHARGCSLADALAEAVAIRDRVLSRFLLVREDVADAAPRLRHYLAALSWLIRGNLDWMHTSRRYFVPAAKSTRSVLVADAPSDGGLGPPPIPAVARWWDITPSEAGTTHEM